MRALAAVAALATLAVALTLFASCARQPTIVTRPGAKLIVMPMGATKPKTDVPVVFVEISATPETRSRGLGGRERMPPDTGMLFVYAADDVRNYWMKDCWLALDIVFIDRDQRIVNLATLPPGAGRPEPAIAHAASKVPARYVLETPAGWMTRNGLGVGDQVDLDPALAGVVPR